MKIRECNIHCPSDPKNKGTYMLRHRYQTRASTATEHCAPLRHSPILHLHACPFFPLPPISTPIPSPPPLADQVSLTLVISFPPISTPIPSPHTLLIQIMLALMSTPPLLPRGRCGQRHQARHLPDKVETCGCENERRGSGWERRGAGCTHLLITH